MSAERTPLGSPRNAKELLDMYFLDLRCHLLETAAAFDRIQRAEGGEEVLKDERVEKLRLSLEVLKSPAADRAEKFLELFSVK